MNDQVITTKDAGNVKLATIEELQSVKTKHKKLIKENSENICSIKGNIELIIQLLEQKDDKFSKKLKKVKAEFNMTIDDYKARLKQSQSLNEQLKQKIEELQRAGTRSTGQITKAVLINDTELKNYEYEKQIDEQNKAIENLKEELAELKIIRSSFSSSLDSKFEEIKGNLQQQLTSQTEEINKMKIMLSSTKEELTLKLNEHETALQIQRKESNSDLISQLEKTIDSLSSDLKQIKSHQHQEMQKLQNAVDELKAVEIKMLQTIYEAKNLSTNTQSRVNCLEMLSAKLMSEEESMLLTEVYELKIKDINAKLSQDDPSDIYSELFSVPGIPNKVKAHAQVSKTGIDVMIQLYDRNNTKLTDLSLPSAVTYIMTDQAENKVMGDYSISSNFFFCDRHNYIKMNKDILDVGFNAPIPSNYIKDDAVKIKILIPHPSTADNPTASDGVLFWKVNCLTKKKRYSFLPFGKLFYKLQWDYESPSFYTSPNGYKVVVLLYLKNASNLTAFLLLLTGKNDASLDGNFPHKLTVTLINQTGQTNNLTSKKESSDVKSCTSVDIEHNSSFEEAGFIKNNSLLLKVVVKKL